MNFLDFLFLIPIAWFAYKGFSKGLVMEVFALAALLVGLYACINLTDVTAVWLKKFFTESWATAAVCVYLVTFAAAFAVVYFSGKLVARIFDTGGLGIVNKLGGAFFGAGKAALIISCLLVAINAVDHNRRIFGDHATENSLLYEPVAGLSEVLMPAIRNSPWAAQSTGQENTKAALPVETSLN